MVRVDKLAGITTAAIIATLLFMLLLVSQPSAANLLSTDHTASGFTLESMYAVPEAEPSEAANPDIDHPDVIKSSVYQLPGALSRQAVAELILMGSGTQSLFANIRAPPHLS